MLKALVGSFAASLAALFSAASLRPCASDWPNKPITILMGFPAGSGVDVVARMLQPSLEKSLGQRLVIDYARRRRQRRVGSWSRALSPTAIPSCWVPRRRTASIRRSITSSVSTSKPTSRRSRPLVDVSNVLTINPDVIDARR